MADYHIQRIFPHNQAAMTEYHALCVQEGLTPQSDFDLLLAAYSPQGELLAAAGSRYQTIRGLVCQPQARGQGLIATIVSQLILEEAQQGHFHLFLYGKLMYLDLYRNLGFYPLAEAGERMVFMENSPTAFADYLQQLAEESTKVQGREGQSAGAIVLNGNPPTLGHLYLLDYAAEREDVLHLFLLSEDLSLFSSQERWQAMSDIVAKRLGVILHGTSHYLISAASFPSYFLKSLDEAAWLQAEIDAKIFIRIAQSLHITSRYLGSEEKDALTAAYNQVLQEQLEAAGIRVVVVKRKRDEQGEIISASKVRQLITSGHLAKALKYLPKASQRLVRSRFSKHPKNPS